jgi:hypothetical protein
MTLLLYLAVAAATLFAWNRWVTPFSRGAAIVLILLPFPFAGLALVTGRVYGGYDMLFLSHPWSDYATDYGLKLPHNWYLLDHVLALAPWQQQVRAAFAQHEWPLWNPGMNSGDILAASMQVAPYNPLNLIALLLPLDLAATFNAAMVFLLAGLFTFAYAREIGCSESASRIAAAGFAFSSAVVFWVGWTHLGSWTLLPFVMLAVRRVVRTRDLASFSLLTIAFVLLILFGHPETMLHVVVIGAAYGVFELVGPHPPLEGVLHSTLLAVAAGIVALMLTAVFLLPFVDVLDDTWQYELFQEQARHPAPVNPAEVWRAVGATFIPYFGGASWYNLTTHYDIGMARVGSVILALALIGACQVRRRREVWFLSALAVIALIAAWSAPPVTTLLRKVPLFAVAKNERLGFAAAFALSMLAAIAFDARDAVSRNRRLAIGVGAALAIATALLWRTRLEFGVQPKMILIGAAAELLGLALLLAAFSSRPRMAIVLVLAAIATQRVAEDGFIYPAVPRRLFYPSVPLLKAIPRDPLYRVVGTANLFIPNAASMFGLQDVRGYASMTYAPYKQTTRLWCHTSQRSYLEVTDLTLPFLSFLGVRHALTPRSMEPPPGWRVVLDDRDTRLMENLRAVPRVFIPRTVRFMNSYETEMEEMLRATDFAEKAWIHDTEVLAQDVANGEADLKVRREGSRYEIDVAARSACRVVITDVGWPGWRAYLDGRRVKTSTANLAFLSVYVPEGKHHLRLVYLPEAFVRGRAISFATILVLSGAIVVRRLRRQP